MQSEIKKPLVSIIVPVHNAEKSIGRCVASLINQTYDNTEIILVENNSDDNSLCICNGFDDNRITVVQTSEKGVSHARNLGMDISNGKYILFCDADDFYSRNHVEKNVSVAETYNSDVVISGYYLKDNEKLVERVMDYSGSITKDKVIKSIFLNDLIMGACWNKMLKKEIIRNCYFPENMTILEDTYFFLKIMKKCAKIYYINKPLYYYCVNDESTVHNFNTLINNDNLVYISSYKKILREFGFSAKIENLIKTRIFITAVWGRNLVKNRGNYSGTLLKNLNNEIMSNGRFFLKDKNFSLKTKIKTLIYLFFPKLL